MKREKPVVIYRHVKTFAGPYYCAEVILIGTNNKAVHVYKTDNNDMPNREQYGDCYRIAKSIAKDTAKFLGCEVVGQHEETYEVTIKGFKEKWTDL
jgi:hypothetical protein